MHARLPLQLKRLLISVFTLWACGAATGARPVAAQPCGEAGCTISIRATTEQPDYRPGEPIVYVLTVQNTSPLRLTFVNVWAWHLSAYSERRGDGPACAVENRAWRRGTDYWLRKLGALGPGEARTMRFCLEVVDPDACQTTQFFSTNGDGNVYDSAVYAALYVTVPNGSCASTRCSPTGEPAVRCCVAEALHCRFNPQDAACESSSSPTPITRLAGLARRTAEAGTRYFKAANDLARLYVLRERLRSTPGGRATVALYETHQVELKRLLLPDPVLRERAVDVLTAWRPAIDGAIDETTTSPRITSAQVGELQSFLAELRVKASPALRTAIDRESAALDLGSTAGLTAEQALQRLDKLTCVADATTLCLSTGRMRVEATWETRDGKRGRGHAVALSGDTGTFWFFGADNVETIAKVVDACALNDRRWFFAAGLTDVRAVTTVTDTVTGTVKTYTNPQGRRFEAVQDTDAFDCTP